MTNLLSRRRFLRYAATGTALGYGGSQGAAISSPPGGYTIYVAPHSHMDIEWYWTYDKTQVLAIGILRQALEMLRKDPGFAFTQDQSAALEPFWNSLSRPDKDFLRSMIQEGRFEVATGTIVQPNISAPDFESLTRQFLLAKPWLENTLGAHIVTCWNIDTYGHTIQMPQLCRQAGLRYFVFMRDVLPSLQESVKSPFHWQGVDGTRILATGYRVPMTKSIPKIQIVRSKSSFSTMSMETTKSWCCGDTTCISQINLPNRLRAWFAKRARRLGYT
jgi:alpha-mannosidase